VKKQTIMVVEDAGDARSAMVRLLQMEGYHAVAAIDAQDALQQLGEVAPDLVLLDVCMPDMDGLTLLSILREDTRWSELTVLIWTASLDDSMIDRAERLGVTDFLLKGTHSWPAMLARVQSVLPLS
jgi:PleD family two-component response regulator